MQVDQDLLDMLKPPGHMCVDLSTPAQVSAARQDVEMSSKGTHEAEESSTTPSQDPEGRSTTLSKDQLSNKREKETPDTASKPEGKALKT